MCIFGCIYFICIKANLTLHSAHLHRNAVITYNFNNKTANKMVQVWYMDKEETDPRLEHHTSPPKYLNLDELFGLTGVEYFKLNLDTYKTDGKLDGIRTERNYDYEDEITCSKGCMPNLEEKLKHFFTEHLHTEEEIRFILDGSGYFDVRDKNDEWIRIAVQGGDMIVIPSGIYHRFTLDTKMYITTKRYFIGKPIWLPHNRPAEDMDCRKIYLDKLNKGFSITA